MDKVITSPGSSISVNKPRRISSTSGSLISSPNMWATSLVPTLPISVMAPFSPVVNCSVAATRSGRISPAARLPERQSCCPSAVVVPQASLSQTMPPVNGSRISCGTPSVLTIQRFLHWVGTRPWLAFTLAHSSLPQLMDSILISSTTEELVCSPNPQTS